MFIKDKEILTEKDRHLQILLLHNQKVNKIQQKYRDECRLKLEAKQKGITYKELLAKQSEVSVIQSARIKTDFDFVIKLKDEEGKI